MAVALLFFLNLFFAHELCRLGAHRDAPLQWTNKSDQYLVQIFQEITLQHQNFHP